MSSNNDYTYGSTPKSYSGQYMEGGDVSNKNSVAASRYPKILLMGMRRSGKSSIQKVVFHKMSPSETLFLETTNSIVKEDISNSSFVQFSIWDFPGQVDFFGSQFESEKVFERCGAIIWVIDAQDDIGESLQKLGTTMSRAIQFKSDIRFEIFIHKVDGLSDDTKMDTQREVNTRSQEDLQEHGLENRVQVSYYLTSIYDHSIFEAFSKVVQKLIPQLPHMEQMLDTFVSNSRIDKAFLFDVISKIYVATDSSPVEMQSYELCCDMIDVVIDVSSIYGLPVGDEEDPCAFDDRSCSIVELTNKSVLYLKQVSNVLALVCIIRKENYDESSGLVGYNFKVIRDCLQGVFDIRRRELEAEAAAEMEAERQQAVANGTSGDRVEGAVGGVGEATGTTATPQTAIVQPGGSGAGRSGNTGVSSLSNSQA